MQYWSSWAALAGESLLGVEGIEDRPTGVWQVTLQWHFRPWSLSALWGSRSLPLWHPSRMPSWSPPRHSTPTHTPASTATGYLQRRETTKKTLRCTRAGSRGPTCTPLAVRWSNRAFLISKLQGEKNLNQIVHIDYQCAWQKNKTWHIICKNGCTNCAII